MSNYMKIKIKIIIYTNGVSYDYEIFPLIHTLRWRGHGLDIITTTPKQMSANSDGFVLLGSFNHRLYLHSIQPLLCHMIRQLFGVIINVISRTVKWPVYGQDDE